MSKSRKLQLHMDRLEEIRTILNSMKNLAMTETHKLGRFLAAQHLAVTNIENAALDFLSHYPDWLPAAKVNERIAIMVGSERGFCGDFNDRLIEFAAGQAYSAVLPIGSRLSARLENGFAEVVETLPGASVTEEVPRILDRLIESIGTLQESRPAFSLAVVYHDETEKRIVERPILPPFQNLPIPEVARGHPPLLNLDPGEFYSELADQYLFAALHSVFYHSLMAENQTRLRHLQGAVQHLDDETVSLHRKFQIFRQEEITEEIEVILLNAEL